MISTSTQYVFRFRLFFVKDIEDQESVKIENWFVMRRIEGSVRPPGHPSTFSFSCKVIKKFLDWQLS